ncbi:hypothetical protein CRUP_001099 [Coryphaenoides rupestris]|nr:hypothetical protein CRUP_001099 [Coryphaenoides rupestris]
MSQQKSGAMAAVVSKKIRCSEYMKKFREPKWESFSKSYEDSLRYRLSRRLLEHAHRPWVMWSGWDRATASSDDSSGRSTPRLSRAGRIAPLSVALPQTSDEFRGRERLSRFEPPPEPRAAGAPPAPLPPPPPESGPGVPARRGSPQREVPGSSGPSETTETDAGPLDSSDEEPARPPGPRPRRPRRAPGPAPPHRGSAGEEGGAVRKPPRAKSQPSLVAKETLQRAGRHHWLDVQPQEKSQRSGLTVANSHWVTDEDHEE